MSKTKEQPVSLLDQWAALPAPPATSLAVPPGSVFSRTLRQNATDGAWMAGFQFRFGMDWKWYDSTLGTGKTPEEAIADNIAKTEAVTTAIRRASAGQG